MLRLDEQTIGFRHELARRAVEGALSSARRQSLHAKILHAFLEQGVEQVPLARLAHHAAAAEDATLVLRFAPAAARQAAAQGAHREAIAHYRTALHYANQMSTEQQAEVLDGLSNEYYLTGQMEEAVAPCEAALALWRALDQRHNVGRMLRRLSRLSWGRGRNAEAQRHGLAAVEELETLPPGRELAMAFANMAHLGTRTTDTAATILWGERAIALAERLSDHETLAYALNSIGTAEIDSGDDRGQIKLQRSLAIALEHGYEEHVARAYGNLAICKVGFRHYAEAEGYLHDGIAYCAERDLDFWGHFLRWVQARTRLEQGDWIGAEEDATALLSAPWMAVTNRLPALLILGRVRARRGDVAAEALFDEARDLALAIGELQRMEQVASARAEWRWLQGDLAGCVAEASVTLRPPLHIVRLVRPWYQSDVVIWLWRSGALSEAPSGVLEPYGLEVSGDWRAAADAWEQIGCPWEQALALMQGDEAAQRTALDIFERLGATPAALISRRRLHKRGARGLPRGPHASTRANQQGLTNRQLEVLKLLAEGLRDVEIADRLSISPRTAEQHVTGVLMKFNARTRAEAVRRAYELGALP
jgi:DNA-binding CsgD family transcriptional regulator